MKRRMCSTRDEGMKKKFLTPSHIGGQEENLRAALLLEQAALCLLRVSPPSVRKYAFHMVLAGLRYNACDQKALGMRAYRSAPAQPFTL